MATKSFQKQNTGMILVVTYLALFLVNSLIIFFANALFPRSVVLGTACLSKTWAIIHSMGALALVNTFALPFIRESENRRGKMFGPRQWLITYLVMDFAVIWLLTRYSQEFGLGISSWLVGLVLAVILDAAQGVVMRQAEKVIWQRQS